MKTRLGLVIVALVVCFGLTVDVYAGPVLSVDVNSGALSIDVEGDWSTNAFQIVSPSGSLIMDPDGDVKVPGMTLQLGNNKDSYAEALFAFPAANLAVGAGSIGLGTRWDPSGSQDLEFSSTNLEGGASWDTIYIPEPTSIAILALGCLGLMVSRRR